jgi:hypothetical protein
MKFKFLTGDINWQDYGGSFISKKLNNGEFDYWLVLQVTNWVDAVGESEAKDVGAKYNVCLSAVSPQQAGDENLQRALGSYGMEGESEREIEFRKDPIMQVECLHSYGVSAPLWQADGNNLSKLMKEARRQADMSNMLFGFYMDGPKNRIGNTGWDFIKGDIGFKSND